MALLAFDTCFGAVSVALRYRTDNGEWIVREAYETRQTGHAERLMPMIAEVMISAGLEFDAVERFAVTVGPGTFTGVRVGVAAAKAFALSAKRPVVGVSSLDVIAARARHLLGARVDGRNLLVAVDARKGGVYCAVQRDNAEAAAEAPLLLSIEDARALACERRALVVGSGGPLIAADIDGRPIDTDLPSVEPHARYLALLAADLPLPRAIAPMYLRNPDVRPQPGPIARQP